MEKNQGPVGSAEDARAVIDEIARKKGKYTEAFIQEAEEEAENGRMGMLQAVEASCEVRKDLAESLEVISTDLYTNHARFLMEVIQNADDNEYTKCETPTISITVFPNHVKIECNEDGFTKENIKALCAIGKSSKPPGQGYTGEKGIGFKSVFKLANRAHIRSLPYYFELDQKRELGMITPQWDQGFFDNHKRLYKTTIVLDRICGPRTDFATALKNDVKAIDPVLILFLRRLDRVQLKLFERSSDDKPAISKKFRCLDRTPNSFIVTIKDEDTKEEYHLYKQRSTIDVDSTEPKRRGITKTDIVLAFPVTKESGTYKPSILDNSVFAYLPLGNFGFKFVIQADFLTTSSRQSVNENNDWNKTIAAAIPFAFENAIDQINSNDSNSEFHELARTWPLYLSHTTRGMSAYWGDIAESINKHLSQACVIKNLEDEVKEPKKLMFLDWAHDGEGEPIFGYAGDYVSRNYPDSIREALLSLGVTTPNWEWVCDKLQELHDEDLLQECMRDKEWCSNLARVILEPKVDRRKVEDLEEIPLIPLADGTWACPPSENDPFYFPASEGTIIPPGLPMSLVDKNACECPKRRRLFKLLGVKNCTVPNVVKHILDYHAALISAKPVHIIAQLQYLYKMRQHLRPGDMREIRFKISAKGHIRGHSTYADISDTGELQQFFSGYSEAHFLDDRYFTELGPLERAEFTKWLSEGASVALAPRFIATNSDRLHTDFAWLLVNKSDQVLAILRQYWSLYKKGMTQAAKKKLAGHEFMCRSGDRAVLRKTYIPFPELIRKAQEFGNADNCHFLVLPSGDLSEWRFLSRFGVGLREGLDFYLWLLHQPEFKEQADVDKSKRLYLAIQSHAAPFDGEKVREAFVDARVTLPNNKHKLLRSCVWDGPKGFSSKPALRPIYGHELEGLFEDILEVPDVTSDEAKEYLEQLRDNKSTTMVDVTEVYVFLQEHYTNTFPVDVNTACIALPSLPGSALEWKTPAQCVWDDKEFSQNELKLESKTAIRRIIDKHASTAKPFFTDVLELPNAGIHELLADLALMQKQKCDKPKRVYLLYERIQSSRPDCANIITKAFEKRPLVFLPSVNDQSSQWLSLKDCIWAQSILRSKHALKPSLDRYRSLFQQTLNVRNATFRMLVTEWRNLLKNDGMEDGDKYHYIKELLEEIARLWRKGRKLDGLDDKECWPCRTPTSRRKLCSFGSFYVNDRQDLFEIFSDSQTFLDFDFETSKKFAGLLRDRGCDSFLSTQVVIKTEARKPRFYSKDLTQDLRGRADALVKYFEWAECESAHELRPLLENVQVWESADIKTHYTLESTTVTKSEGGSSVKISSGKYQTPKLKIYVSEDKSKRDCALVTDLPEQLVAALELEPANLPDLLPFLQVPLPSLEALLIRKGITAGDVVDDSEEVWSTDSVNKDSQDASEDTYDDSGDDASAASTSSVRSDSTGSVVAEATHALARSRTANSTLQPLVDYQPSSRSTTRAPPLTVHLYHPDNRDRNKKWLQGFALNADSASSSRSGRSRGQPRNENDAFDMSTLRGSLEEVDPSPRLQAGLILHRNEEDRMRDFEVGFLGELFIYHTLLDYLKLPNFTAEDNWTSSLRHRAGFSRFGRHEVSDFTYKDTQGELTRHFLQMKHPYETPEWLSTVCDNGNAPLYQLEVKTTTSQNPSTAFYMSSCQHNLAKELRVTSARPEKVYVVLRISGLDALEDQDRDRPQYRVYLDPYTLSEKGVLNFVPTYAVRATV